MVPFLWKQNEEEAIQTDKMNKETKKQVDKLSFYTSNFYDDEERVKELKKRKIKIGGGMVMWVEDLLRLLKTKDEEIEQLKEDLSYANLGDDL